MAQDPELRDSFMHGNTHVEQGGDIHTTYTLSQVYCYLDMSNLVSAAL